MIVSLLYKVTRKLLSVPSVLLRGEAAKDAELRSGEPGSALGRQTRTR
ncbi:hypothetical protein [Saccharothrix texasensis]|uniref:Uncharacterized protein n=1 Tax=Saccharothrix texasensis TaxID=103734 RepID=A0A3N1HH62_9PSEU|nr:hypothetical protein [Saccharothrix texasensis]ROP41847.1 hypothetical protein EDD40_7310 [Saccharothrix texasensis]